jgi:hypothetical protein
VVARGPAYERAGSIGERKVAPNVIVAIAQRTTTVQARRLSA